LCAPDSLQKTIAGFFSICYNICTDDSPYRRRKVGIYPSGHRGGGKRENRCMEQRIRILGIAPYENMKTMMQEVVEQYPQIALNVFVGDLEEGVELARRNFYNDYDVIISRGGTAELLRKNLDLPVIEIKMSQLDILRAMKLAEHVSDHYAIVGFSNITVNARYLCQMMQYKADIYTIQN